MQDQDQFEPMPQVTATMLLLGREEQDAGIVKAVEIRYGAALIVVVTAGDGIIGIGNVVHSRKDGLASRAKAIEHAINRVAHLRQKRAERRAFDEAERAAAFERLRAEAVSRMTIKDAAE